jgi:hypothetical protein
MLTRVLGEASSSYSGSSCHPAGSGLTPQSCSAGPGSLRDHSELGDPQLTERTATDVAMAALPPAASRLQVPDEPLRADLEQRLADTADRIDDVAGVELANSTARLSGSAPRLEVEILDDCRAASSRLARSMCEQPMSVVGYASRPWPGRSMPLGQRAWWSMGALLVWSSSLLATNRAYCDGILLAEGFPSRRPPRAPPQSGRRRCTTSTNSVPAWPCTARS